MPQVGREPLGQLLADVGVLGQAVADGLDDRVVALLAGDVDAVERCVLADRIVEADQLVERVDHVVLLDGLHDLDAVVHVGEAVDEVRAVAAVEHGRLLAGVSRAGLSGGCGIEMLSRLNDLASQSHYI